MLTRTIPTTGEPIPVIGLGTWQTFDRRIDRAESATDLLETLRTLYDGGGRVVDSSPMYGKSERAIGQLAEHAGITRDLFIATKVWTMGKAAGVRQMMESMRRLGRDTIDLMQIHNLVDWKTHLATLRQWKDEGRVRYIGITHYHPSAYDKLESILRREPLDFIQLAYSPWVRDAERTLLPLAAERGVAVVVNRPFEEGSALRGLLRRPLPPGVSSFASTWAEAVLKFIVAHPAVTCVIPATAKPQHMRDNLLAGEGCLPNTREREELVAAIR